MFYYVIFNISNINKTFIQSYLVTAQQHYLYIVPNVRFF